MPSSSRTSVITTPWRASDGAVRKNRPLSSAVERPGDVAEGEIMTVPFARATFDRIAPVTPEQSAPMMPSTLSDVTRRSAAAVAAAASIHVLSARTPVTFAASNSMPEAVTSSIAASAPPAICCARDSSGPVKPKMIPSLTSLPWPPAKAVVAVTAVSAVAINNFFITISHVGSKMSVHDITHRFANREAVS